MELISGADKIYYYVKENKKATFSEISKKFNLTEEKVEQLAIILSKAKLLSLVYPTNPFLEPFLTIEKKEQKHVQQQEISKEKGEESKEMSKFNFPKISMKIPNPFKTNKELQKEKKYLKQLQTEAAAGILSLKKIDAEMQMIKKEKQSTEKNKTKAQEKEKQEIKQIQEVRKKLSPIVKKILKFEKEHKQNKDKLKQFEKELKKASPSKKKQLKKWIVSRKKKAKDIESRLKKLKKEKIVFERKLKLINLKLSKTQKEKDRITKEFKDLTEQEIETVHKITKIKKNLNNLSREMDLVLEKINKMSEKLKQEIFKTTAISITILLALILVAYLLFFM